MQVGGIIALVGLNDETDGALAADMLERLHVPLSHAHIIGWGQVWNWARHLDESSYTHRALHSEQHAPLVLMAEYVACCADALAALNFNYCKVHGGKGKKPEPIERPWKKPQTKHIGAEPIPIMDFEDWYYGG